MKESIRITKLFSDLYNGSPWIDLNLVDTLKNIGAAKASKKTGNYNTIWQIVHHMIEWRYAVLERLHGAGGPSPADNYFIEIKDTSPAAWEAILKRFEDSQSKWLDYLDDLNEDTYDTLFPQNNMSYYDHIIGILQHDAYHLGQVVLLAKD